jgi:RNA polymerase sigma factor (sigma-70 family)
MGVSPAYSAFMTEAEPRLRGALVARYGIERGRDAALEAMVYAWRHWDRVGGMENPVGYLYRVGSSSVRRNTDVPQLAPVDNGREPWVEPALDDSLDMLSEPQRIAVVLRHGFEWTYQEIADLLDVSVSTVRSNLARGMDKLRIGLEVSVDG